VEDSGDGIFDVELVRIAVPAAEELYFVIIKSSCGCLCGGTIMEAVACKARGVDSGGSEQGVYARDEGTVVEGFSVETFEEGGICGMGHG
jgi:hypothetical protein